MIDIEKLRKIAETRYVGLSYNYTPWTYMQAAGEYFPALLDELEATRTELERLREELRKAVELLKEAAPRFVSYEECMDWQDQGEDCIAKDGHWEHELRTKMDEFVERNKETK